jgi:hypothetical protein
MSYISARPISPKIIPKVQLSPQIKQKIAENQKISKIKQINKKPKVKSPNKRTKLYRLNKQKFIHNPGVNPETNRKIKQGGRTYKNLVSFYGTPI